MKETKNRTFVSVSKNAKDGIFRDYYNYLSSIRLMINISRHTQGTVDENRLVYHGWWVVAVAALAMSTGPGQFAFGALGLFIKPLGEEFGWDRAQVSLAATYFTIALAFSIPVIGQLVDRYGSRKVLLPSILVFALLLALPALLVDALWKLFLLYILMGSLGAGANALPYLRTLATWFDARRGLAIGIAMGGSGMGFAYAPPLIQHVIDTHGWQAAYLCLAAFTLILTVPLVYFFLYDAPAEQGGAGGRAQKAATSSLKLLPLLQSRLLWQLFLIFCLLSFGLYGVLAHLAPMMSDRGMSMADAALVQSTLGIAIVASRIFVGYLIDRFNATRVACVCFLISAAGVGMLTYGAVDTPAFVAALCIGLSLGAEIDMLAYLTSRYFGVDNFGKIYGILFVSFLSGTALGPYVFGLAYEMYGSYREVLFAAGILIIISAVVTLLLPSYTKNT